MLSAFSSSSLHSQSRNRVRRLKSSRASYEEAKCSRPAAAVCPLALSRRVEENRPKMKTSQATVLFGLVMLAAVAIASAQDIYSVLNQYPQYATFAQKMNSTGVVAEANSRSSITILLPQNFDGYLGGHSTYTTQEVADVLRYHVLLQYYDCESLKQLTKVEEVTTLYQTTGRANGLDGFINITNNAGTVQFSPSTPGSPVQATLIGNVTQFPYNYSFCSISGVVEPIGLLAAQLAPTTPPSMAPAPAPTSAGPSTAPTTAPSKAPATAPAAAPGSAPATAPGSAPATAPGSAPATAPESAPAAAPGSAPATAPATVPTPAPSVRERAPTPAPTKAPAKAPIVPPSPLTNGPTAQGPAPASSSAFALKLNVAALVVSVFVAAFLF